MAEDNENDSISTGDLRKQRREAARPNPAPEYDENGDVVPETEHESTTAGS